MKAYVPQKMKNICLDLIELIPLISKANASLSNYNGALKHLIDPYMLMSPMIAKEATLSSRIEGTQATLAEVYLHETEEKFPEYKCQDIGEINNYQNALYFAVEKLTERPFIHLNMLKEVHSVLLNGVRGKNKGRGEFRNVQNWIGSSGATIETAIYVPPAPNLLLDALDDWEKFVNSDYVDPLIQLGLVHAQFEIIHPFLDGNGRLGRILIPIFLFQKHYLDQPAFYLSEYLEQHREMYYKSLNDITTNQNWQGWIKFFLQAITVQAQKSLIKVGEIMNLYENTKKQIQAIKSQYSQYILDVLFKNPIITSSKLARELNLERIGTAHRLLQRLEQTNVLKIMRQARGNRGSVYVFDNLMRILTNEI